MAGKDKLIWWVVALAGAFLIWRALAKAKLQRTLGGYEATREEFEERAGLTAAEIEAMG